MPNTVSCDLTRDDIDAAFNQGHFDVLFQPQVSLSNREEIVGAEAFVRLNHPVLGPQVPVSFLPLLEKMGKMEELSFLVVQRVMEEWKSWQSHGFDIRISVNINSEMFLSDSFVKGLSNLIEQQTFPSNRLTLEIAQYHSTDINEDFADKLTRLSTKGFRIALDDFGKHPIDPKVVIRLPVNEIKIHRDVIAEIGQRSGARKIVRDALHLSSQTGIRAVAVGVENQKDADWLQRQSCDSGQGYLYGKPVSAEEFSNTYLQADTSWKFTSQADRLKILVVEDEELFQDLLREALSDLYEVHVASTGQEAEILYEAHKPEIIVSDVNLPDFSGIDLIQDLSSNEDNAFSVIFISGSDDQEHRLKAYDAGGVDFLGKPFSMVELRAKIDRVAAFQSKRKQLATTADDFQSVALQSMQEASHYGDVVHLFKNLFRCQDELAIAHELFMFMQNKGLKSSIQFRSSESTCSFDQNERVCSPIEMNVFEILANKGRLYDFGSRTIVNDHHVSILIKNMPEDEEEHGRIRDFIAVIIEGMEARYNDIIRQRVMKSAFEQLQGLAHELTLLVDEEKKPQGELLEQFSLELSMSFHVLDMTEEQEQHITEIVQKMLKAKDDGELNAEHVTDRIGEVVQLLEKSLNEIESSQTEDKVEEQDDEDGGIELF